MALGIIIRDKFKPSTKILMKIVEFLNTNSVSTPLTAKYIPEMK
jgi:hypothetical protein